MIQKIQFSEWLQSKLDKRQWTQSELARAARLSRAVANKLLNKKTYPQPETLKEIARALKVPVETAYRAAGFLPMQQKTDAVVEEIAHKMNLIKSPERRKNVFRLFQALIDEEENSLVLKARVYLRLLNFSETKKASRNGNDFFSFSRQILRHLSVDISSLIR